MTIYYLIKYFQTFIWLGPIYRQWKSTDYKYFFIIFGIQDLIVDVFLPVFKIGSYQQYIVWAAILLISFLPYFKTVKRVFILILLCLPFIALTNYIPNRTANFIITIQYAAVFFIFIYKFIKYYSVNHTILVFHIVLLVYMFSIVVKLAVMLAEVKTGLIYYMTTTFFQMFAAIYFMIDSDYKPKFFLLRDDVEE